MTFADARIGDERRESWSWQAFQEGKATPRKLVIVNKAKEVVQTREC